MIIYRQTPNGLSRHFTPGDSRAPGCREVVTAAGRIYEIGGLYAEKHQVDLPANFRWSVLRHGRDSDGGALRRLEKIEAKMLTRGAPLASPKVEYPWAI